VTGDLFNVEGQRDPLIGRTLDGRYEVLERLGAGGMGVVYRGRQAQLGRFVAIKVLHRDTAAVPEWRQRFEREARALSALAHPNVVPVTDSGIDRGVPFLVMELLQGKTLAALIKEGPLPLWRALDIARQTLRGLAFAHGKGIIHRDLKPTNVFLQELPDQADHVRLLDFGTAKFLEGSGSDTMTETLTRVGVVFGTPAYMSPEQAKAAPVDARTDVYAAGILLFELLAGRRPFVVDSQEGYIGAHLTQPVPSLAKVRPGIAGAPSFQTVIERAMAKAPAARFKDAAALLAALEAVVARLPAGAMRSRRTEGRMKPMRPHRAPLSRVQRGAMVLVAFAAATTAVALYVRRRGPRTVDSVALPASSPARPGPPAAQPPSAVALRAIPSPTSAPPISPVAAPAPPNLPPPTGALPAEPSPNRTPSPSSPPSATTSPQEPPSEAAPAATAPLPTENGPAAALPVEPPPKVSPPTSPPPPSRPEEAGAPGNNDDRRPGARDPDPWREPVPRALRPIRERLARGAHMSQRALRPAYTFAHQNPGDPRPWLLLGHAYAQLDWLSDSVERYVHAHHVDPASRGDPQMLADLLDAAAHPTAARAGARAIRDIYGAGALPALDKAIERRAGDRDATARLARLRASLSP
jgi:eukaryotic-like serine/threonine-protein kinase